MLQKCYVWGCCITANELSQSTGEISSSEEMYSGIKAALVLYLLWHNASRPSATRDACLRERRMTLHFGLWVEKEGIVPSDWLWRASAPTRCSLNALQGQRCALFTHPACADRCCSTPALCWPLHAHDLCFTSLWRRFIVLRPKKQRLRLNL